MTTANPAEADPRAVLRDRLAEMREAIVAEMVRDGYSSGLGARLAEIAATMDALGRPPAHESAEGLPSTEKSASALSALSPRVA